MKRKFKQSTDIFTDMADRDIFIDMAACDIFTDMADRGISVKGNK
jgi:hypothetical protein